jgi:hypothetical protein
MIEYAAISGRLWHHGNRLSQSARVHRCETIQS